MTPGERFNRYYEETPTGCWEWAGACNNKGYGQFYHSGRMVSAHRFSYELVHGAIAPGLVIDHLCRNRRCVNPAHLEPVTNRENTLRGAAPGAVLHVSNICAKNHDLSEPGSYYRRGKNGTQKYCVICHREANRKSYRRSRKGASNYVPTNR